MAIDPKTGAITSRLESVYDYPQLGLFFITGQPTNEQRFDGLGMRNASVGCKPYNTLTSSEHVDLKRKSEDIVKSHVDITVDAIARKVFFHDTLTRITTQYSFNILDTDIRQRIERSPTPVFQPQ